ERLQQHHLQVAAMNAELRPVVARVQSAWIVIDELAEAWVVGNLGGRDADPRQVRLQAEFGQRLGGMGQEVDADAEALDLGGGLEDAAGDARRLQPQTQGKTADSGADDDDVHDLLRKARKLSERTPTVMCRES